MGDAKKILVVDDEPALREMIQLRVEAAGYDVVMASNGQEGLEKARKEMPDLIISDVLMPVMDGFSFYKELKKDAALAQVPVLILTARGKMEDSFKVMGADDFIAKPFDGKYLLARVDEILGSSAQVATEPPPSPAPQKPETRAAPVVVSGRSRKILLAGSFPKALENIGGLLKKDGHYVETVLSGKEVVPKAAALIPDLLIMDVLIEQMDAAEVIRVIRTMPPLDRMKVLTYSYYNVEEMGTEDVRETALSIDNSSEKCLEEGALEYLGRFYEHSFLNSVRKYL